MTLRLQFEPQSLRRIEALFNTMGDTRLAAAVDAVLAELEAGRPVIRQLQADGRTFHIPDEVRYRSGHVAAAGIVLLSVEEPPGR